MATGAAAVTEALAGIAAPAAAGAGATGAAGTTAAAGATARGSGVATAGVAAFFVVFLLFFNSFIFKFSCYLFRVGNTQHAFRHCHARNQIVPPKSSSRSMPHSCGKCVTFT